METYINIGNFVELRKNLDLFQQKIDAIAEYYDVKNFEAYSTYMANKQDVDMVIRVVGGFNFLSYASKDYYESDEWEQTVDIISYDKWLSVTRPKNYADSDSDSNYEKHNHYIYLLKDDLSFALMTMSGDVSDDYITLLDYSDISDVNVYTAEFLLDKVPSGFNMDKFHQIPVKNSNQATINDVWNFLKGEK